MTISSAARSELQAVVAGAVIGADDADYDQLRLGFQRSSVHRPDLIVAASSAEDVAAALRFATAHDLPVAVQATGHGGAAKLDGGLLVSTAALNRVSVDPATGLATVGAGATWGAVAEAASPHGLVPPLGGSPGVGVAGYTLGGGLSIFGRTTGWAADRLRSIEIVTADGRILTADATSEPELFWALRGGGGSFVVATQLTIELGASSPLFGGGLFFDASRLDELLRAWRDFTVDLPRDTTTSFGVVPFPDLDVLPPPLRGRLIASIRVAHLGDPAEGARLVAPLLALDPLLGGFDVMPIAASGSINMDPTDPAPSRIDHTLVRELPDAAIDAIVAVSGPGGPTPFITEIRHLGGALVDVPADGSPIGNRDAQFLVVGISVLPHEPAEPADIDAARSVHGGLLAAVEPWSTGGHLFNWIEGDAAVDEIRSAFTPEAWDRLRAVKQTWDPDNRLHHAVTIPPA